MSRAKLATVSVVTALCLQNVGRADDGSYQLPALSTADIEFSPATEGSLVSYVNQDTSAAEGFPQAADGSSPSPNGDVQTDSNGDTQSPSSSRKLVPQRSASDKKDATEVAKPKVVEPPITLGDLSVPNISLDNIGTGNVPDDVTADRMPSPIPLPLASDRGVYLYQSKLWVPGGFCHQPLYFEDIMLERHGHQRLPYLQPFVSAAKFYGTIPLAPYKWTLQQPLEDRHTLGSFRPGTPAPVVRQRLPYDKTAIRNQIGASAAAAVAIP